MIAYTHPTEVSNPAPSDGLKAFVFDPSYPSQLLLPAHTWPRTRRPLFLLEHFAPRPAPFNCFWIGCIQRMRTGPFRYTSVIQSHLHVPQ
jgi:hypothetical protein